MTSIKRTAAFSVGMNKHEPATTNKGPYSLDDLTRGHRWLGHQKYTELNAVSDDPKVSTKIAYVPAGETALVHDFVRRNHKGCKLFWGVNERPHVLENDRGYARSARNTDIEYVSNILIDIDLKSQRTSNMQLRALEGIATHEAGDWFEDNGYVRPVVSVTGGGVHLKAALPRVKIADQPGITDRIKYWALREFGHDLKDELENIEAQIDSTFDARRMARMDGTAKPSVGYVSRFLGGERHEDQELLTHLLSMSLPEQRQSLAPLYGMSLVTVSDRLPLVFEQFLKRDQRLRDLYEGRGKDPKTDTSGSGYDLALTRRALLLGISDISDLATILAHRPGGSVINSGKGIDYIRRTIAAALAGKQY